MKWRQLLTRKYWWRAAVYFTWLLVVYTVVRYYFREEGENFWSLAEVQGRLSTALFMALVFAYRHREQAASSVPEDSDIVKTRWSFLDFLGIFGLLLVFFVVIASLLYVAAWLVLHFIFQNNEPFGKIYLRMVLTASVLCILMTLFLYVTDRLSIRWNGPPS